MPLNLQMEKRKKEIRGSRITISIEKKDNLVVVSIKDDGKGIDHKIFPRLFEKFVTKSKIGGTGLGLYSYQKVLLNLTVAEYGLRIIMMVKEQHLVLVLPLKM